MPKKKKTRREKVLTDLRRQTSYTLPPIPLVQEPNVVITDKLTTRVTLPQIIKQTSVILTNDYRYLSKDLLKTAILTSSIIVAEIVAKLLHF